MVKGNSAAANADPLIYDCMAAFYMACASFMSQNAPHPACGHTKLIAQDTIEEKIVELQQAKQDLAETVTGSADGAILRMKPEELLNLLEGTE